MELGDSISVRLIQIVQALCLIGSHSLFEFFESVHYGFHLAQTSFATPRLWNQELTFDRLPTVVIFFFGGMGIETVEGPCFSTL